MKFINLILTSAIFVFLTFASSIVYGGGLGVYIDPMESGEFAVEVVNNLTFNKKYETGTDNRSKNIIDEKNDTYVKLSYSLTDFSKVYALVGAINEFNLKLDWTDGTHNEIKTKDTVLWGGGLGLIYSFNDIFFIGSDTHYLEWEADIDSVTETGVKARSVSGKYKYFEAQETIYIGKRFDTIVEGVLFTFVPYIGGTYHYSEYDVPLITYKVSDNNGAININGSQNEDNFGVVLGADLGFGESFRLNIEGRAIVEEAITLSAGYKF